MSITRKTSGSDLAKEDVVYKEGPLQTEMDMDVKAVLPSRFESYSEDDLAKLNKSVTRRIDLLIMPVMVLLYILNYLDRQNIASAKLANITVDLNVTATQYQTCISILFVGYIGFQIPSNMILGKIKKPAMYICIACAVWGGVSACTAAVNNFAGLLVCRFILGIVEAVFFPGAIFYLSCWYRKEEYAFRLAILYSGSQLGNAFGGLLAIGILELAGQHGLEGWRWLFLIEGVATVGLGLLCIFILPNSPQSTRWLSDEQKEILVYRLEADKVSKDETEECTAWRGLVLSVTDPKVWLIIGILFFDFIGAAVTNFFPSVVSTLGFSRNITLVLTAPPYIVCVFAIWINGYVSDRRQKRFQHIWPPLILTILANVIAVATLNTGARYVAMCLMPGAYYMASTITVSWLAGSMCGPRVKRAVAMSLVNSCVNLPNIWTSYLYSGAPQYLVAFSVNLASSVVALGFATATWWYLRRQNAKMARGETMPRSGPDEHQVRAGWRYPL